MSRPKLLTALLLLILLGLLSGCGFSREQQQVEVAAERIHESLQDDNYEAIYNGVDTIVETTPGRTFGLQGWFGI